MPYEFSYNQFKQLIVNPYEPRDIEKARDLLEDYDGYYLCPVICLNEENGECDCPESIGHCLLYNIIPPECEFKKEIERTKRLNIVKEYQIEYDMTEFWTEESILSGYTSKAKSEKKPVQIDWKSPDGKIYHNAMEFYYKNGWVAESRTEPGTISFYLPSSGTGIECPMRIYPNSEDVARWVIPKALGLNEESTNNDIPMEFVAITCNDMLLAVIYRYKRKRYWIEKSIMFKYRPKNN